MPDDGNGGSVDIRLDGTHLKVDARPARLVSQLRGPSGDPVLTAQQVGADAKTEAVPAGARQVTFQVSDDLSVEASRGADFVALAEEGGRRLVVAFTGEVTVVPAGGERFALAAHDALLIPSGGGEPRVVPADSLSEEDQDEVSGAVEAASLAVLAPASETPAPTPEPEKPAAEPEKPAAEPEKPAAVEPAKPAAAAPAKPAPTTPAAAKKAGGQPPLAAGPKRGKKGKKGRPQPGPGKKAAPLVPAGGAAAPATPPTAKKAGSPTKKSGPAPVKKTPPPAKAAATKRASDDASYEDTPQDRRVLIGALAVGVLLAVVLAVFALTGDEPETDGDATPATTSATTEAPTTEPAAVTTTTAASTTSAAPTTTAPRSTTTAAPPTTAAAPVVNYAIEPKSCVQSGNSITYTATIQNKSTAAFDYTIRVVFKDTSGATVASDDATVSRLGANQSTDFSATGTSSRNLAGTGASCDVEKVDARRSGS